MRRGVYWLLGAVLLTGCSQSPDPSHPGETAETDTAVLSAAEMQAAWWSWTQAAPVGQDPADDATGKHCSVGQPDRVWFLAGTYGGHAVRTCEVPRGRSIVAPAVNLISPKREDCETFLAEARGSVTLDGVAVEVERVEPVNITFDSTDGPLRAVACGLWARIPAPDPGEHSVQIKGRSGSLHTSVDYTISIP